MYGSLVKKKRGQNFQRTKSKVDKTNMEKIPTTNPPTTNSPTTKPSDDKPHVSLLKLWPVREECHKRSSGLWSMTKLNSPRVKSQRKNI